MKTFIRPLCGPNLTYATEKEDIHYIDVDKYQGNTQ